MRFAVLLIANTTLRPSTILKLRHLHFRRREGTAAWEKKQGVAYTEILIPKHISKRKDRDRVVISHDYDATYGYYERFKNIQEEFGHPTGPSELVFGSTRNPDRPASLTTYFRKLLEDWGLLEDWSQGYARNRVLYSLRAYGITKALERGVPIHVVAHNSQTSVRMIEKHYSQAISWNLREFIHKNRVVHGGRAPDYAPTSQDAEREIKQEAENAVEEKS